uniref:WGS project CAEQ00000000 data, annotated contig 131 n=1 Tax=Trypanosoma congolense (strain IL3000) TaxID=1068625 RepID=F9W5E4_TRYCI|nr:unnamed protein product [Trypanosoma congolense IL3000]
MEPQVKQELRVTFTEEDGNVNSEVQKPVAPGPSREEQQEVPDESSAQIRSKIKKLLDKRALYRTIIIILLVLSIVTLLDVVATSTMLVPTFANDTRNAVLVVAPSLHPQLLEHSMETNKAPFMGLIATSGRTYFRNRKTPLQKEAYSALKRKTSGEQCITQLNSPHNELLHELVMSQKRLVVLPPPSNPVNLSACGTVGGGQGVEILPESSGKGQMFADNVFKAFERLTNSNGNLLYVHTDVGSGAVDSGEGYLSVLSEISNIDRALQRLSVIMSDRARRLQEKWMVMVVASEGNATGGVSLLTTTFIGDQVVDSLPESGHSAGTDVHSMLANWFGLSSSA